MARRLANQEFNSREADSNSDEELAIQISRKERLKVEEKKRIAREGITHNESSIMIHD